VHLNLQTLLCLFFSLAFLLIAYLVLPLLLPRPQIKQLGTLLSLPIYLSAKFKQFGQTSFSILLQKLKHGMTQIELLDHPSKFSKGEAMNALFSFLENMGSLSHQSRAYLACEVTNHEI